MNIAEKALSLINNSKASSFINKERFITGINKELSLYLKNMLQIPKTEKILIVLDDSFFKNLKQVVVFTTKKIYWNIHNAYIKSKDENAEASIRGQGLINNKSLNNASIFSKNEKDMKTVYIISEDIQLIIPFTNFENESSLTLTFYDYLSNHCREYKPNYDINGKIFSNIKKTNKVVNINIVSMIFSAMSYLIALIFLASLIFQFIVFDNEIVIYIFILLKAFSIIFGNRKSLYINLLIIIITPLIVYWLKNNELAHYERSVFVIYSGIFILLGIFDFDKIFKYLALILAIISILFMIQYIVV